MDTSPAFPQALPVPAAPPPAASEDAAAAVEEGDAMDVDVGANSSTSVAEPVTEGDNAAADLVLDHGKISFDSETSRFELHLSLKGNLTHLANLESQGERPRSFLQFLSCTRPFQT
mmetsp:Transcript_81169/g.230361  ORF Transcript_81169/g.230361 Transcript_81169/m.230361 type:complete len:116 (+) Transcript_81169:54-401(+)